MLQSGLKTRLMTLFILFAVLPAALGGLVSLYMNYNFAKQATQQSNELVGQQVGNQVRQLIESSQGLTEALAASPTAKSMDAAAIRDMIITAQQKNPHFELFYVMDTTGMQIARTSGNLANRADRPYFKEALKGNTYFTDVYISAFTNAPTITISLPVKNQAGAIVGVFAADISLKAIWEITDKIKIGSNGYIDIVDNKGTLIAHPDKEAVLKKESLAGRDYIDKAIAGSTGADVASSSRGDQTLLVYTPVGKINWGVIVYQPVSEIMSTITKTVMAILLAIVLAIIVAVWTAFYVTKGIANPIQQLIAIANQIADGDVSQRYDAKMSGIREMNQLSAAFAAMAGSLRDIIKKALTTSESVSAASEELAASAAEVGKQSQEVTHTIVQVAGESTSQLKLAEKSLDIIGETVKSLADTTAAAHSVAKTSEQSEILAQKGTVQISQAVDNMNEIMQEVGTVSERIYQLGDKSRQIGQIVEVITGLAGQTNLLALNAAIEAARAGEQGRGFAVVAEEVRKLAEQSETAAKEITAIVLAIQKETEQAVEAIDKSSRGVSNGASTVEASGQAFRQICAAVDTMRNEIARIVNLAEKQQSGSVEMEQAVTTIVAAARENAANANGVAASTQQQNATVEEIASATVELAKLATELQQTVIKFRL